MSIENPYEFLSREDLIAVCRGARQQRTTFIYQLREGVKGLHIEVPNEHGYRNCLKVFKSLCENCSDEQQQPVEYPCRGLSDVLSLIEKAGEE